MWTGHYNSMLLVDLPKDMYISDPNLCPRILESAVV